MASPDLTAAQVMDAAAARLNDASKERYTYTVQIPFLNIALAELQELYEANNVPVTDQTSALINVPLAAAGIVEIGYTGVAGQILPSDLIEPKVVWESPEGLNQWTTMSKVDYFSQNQSANRISSLINYQWASNKLKVLAADADNDLKIDYVRSIFPTVTDSTDELGVINSASFLWNRTASLIANDIEENQQRASYLYADALGGLDRSLTITTKGRQQITIRRRPFRSGFKSNSQMW